MTDTPAAQLEQLGDEVRKAERGEKAFNALRAYEAAVAAYTGHDPVADDAYQAGSFESRDDLHEYIRENAFEEVKKFYAQARSKTGFIATEATIENHPCNDYEHAYEWLLKTGWPLLNDEVYAELGTTRKDFFEGFKAAHIDAARQKIRIAQDLVDAKRDADAGLVLIKNVLHTHLPRLGVLTIHPALAQELNSTPETIWGLYKTLTQQSFKDAFEDHIAPNQLVLNEVTHDGNVLSMAQIRARRQEIEDLKSYSFQPGSVEYAEEIVRIENILRTGADVVNDPETFAGTGFTRETFFAAHDKAVQDCLDVYLDDLHRQRPSAHKDAFRNTLEKIKNLRSLYAVDQGEQTDEEVENPGVDNWMSDTFTAWNYNSYQHFLQQAYVSRGSRIINGALATKRKKMPPAQVYENLLSGQDLLREARYPIHHRGFLSEIGINYDAMSEKLRENAVHAANRNWNIALQVGSNTEDMVAALGIVKCALMQGQGAKTQTQPFVTPEELLATEMRFAFRQAEEVLANYQLCADGDMAFKMLEPAFTTLAALDIRLEDRSVQTMLGLPPEEANAIVSQYKMLEAINSWYLAGTDVFETEYRLAALNKFKARYAEFDDTQKAQFLDHLGAEPSFILPIRGVELAIRRKQVFEGVAALQKEEGDVVYAAAQMQTIRQGLTDGENPTLNDDVFFQRVVASLQDDHPVTSRDAFAATIEGLRERVYAQVRPISEIFAPSAIGRKYKKVKKAAGNDAQFVVDDMLLPSAEARLKQIHAAGPTGEKAFKEVDNIAIALRLDGRSILDEDVLNASGFTPASLKKFMDDCALSAAWTYIDAEDTAGDEPALSFQDIKNHPFTHLTNALGWVQRRGHPIMSDLAWEDLGTSRQDFTALYRKALVNQKDALERNVVPAELWNGVGNWLESLNTLYDCYDLLDTEPKDRKLNAQSAGDLILRTQSRIRRHVVTLKTKSTNDTYVDASASTKYKKMIGIFNLGVRVDDTFASHDKSPLLRGTLSQMLELRLTKLFDMWDRHPGDAARGAYIARSILKLRETTNVEEFPWFTPLLTERGFDDFESFNERMAQCRIRQLATRIEITHTRNDVQSQASVLEDIGRLKELVADGLIEELRKNDILRGVQWPEDRIHDAYKTASRICLPTLARQALYPAMGDDERTILIEHCQNLAKIVGPGDVDAMQIDWKHLKALHTKALQCRAADLLIMDDLRSKNGTMNEPLMAALDQIKKQNPNLFSQTRLMAGMGLASSEMSRIQRFNHMGGCFNALLDMRASQDEGVNTDFTEVVNFYGAVHAAKIDLTDKDVLETLGFSSVSEFNELIDPKAFTIVAALSHKLQMADAKGDANTVRYAAKELCSILEITTLDQRYMPEILMEKKCFTSQEAMDIEARHKNTKQPKAAPQKAKKRAPASNVLHFRA